ncbi:hypothetical protein OAG34_01525 [bacterium]|nr:hypothetical protein [bacterium]
MNPLWYFNRLEGNSARIEWLCLGFGFCPGGKKQNRGQTLRSDLIVSGLSSGLSRVEAIMATVGWTMARKSAGAGNYPRKISGGAVPKLEHLAYSDKR